MALPAEMIPVLAQFAPAFTTPTYQKALLLIVGTILAKGRRTVTSALRAVGHTHTADWAKYHVNATRSLCWRPCGSMPGCLSRRCGWSASAGAARRSWAHVCRILRGSPPRRPLAGSAASCRGTLAPTPSSIGPPARRGGGTPPLPIRWVLVRDPQGQRPLRAFFSTDPAQTAPSIIADFVNRWPLEVTFEEARSHLGLGTQRQWNDLAIERTTPALLGLFSLIVLLAQALYPTGDLPLAHAAWYPQTHATFHDVLALVRRRL